MSDPHGQTILQLVQHGEAVDAVCDFVAALGRRNDGPTPEVTDPTVG